MPKKVIPTLRDLRRGIGRPVPPPPFTQQQVEKLSGAHWLNDPIDQTTLSKLERGQRRASDSLLYRLSVLYGVSYDFIRLSAQETLRQSKGKPKRA